MKRSTKSIILVIVGLILGASITVTATLVMSANDIAFSSDKTDKTNVKDALDELFNKAGKGSTKYDASQVTLTTSYNTEVQTLQDALDDLYSKRNGN